MNYLVLRRIRELRNLSIDEVAKAINVEPQNYGLSERGLRSISAERLAILADLFKCSVTLFDSPILFSGQDINYHLKALALGEPSAKIILAQHGSLLQLGDSTIISYLDSFRRRKLALTQGQISEQEYLDFVFNNLTLPSFDSFPCNKWKYFRERMEVLDPSIDAKICEIFSGSFYGYLEIEDGSKRPSAKAVLEISKLFGTTPEFLMDPFQIMDPLSLEVFLSTIDICYPGKLRLSDNGHIKIEVPQVQFFLERLFRLQDAYNNKKISKSELEVKVLAC